MFMLAKTKMSIDLNCIFMEFVPQIGDPYLFLFLCVMKPKIQMWKLINF